MLLSCRKEKRTKVLCKSFLDHIFQRKEILSPLFSQKYLHQVRAFFFAPLRGSLTVETALVLPVFLFCMIAALQYCNVMETSVKIAGSLCDTGKNMAVAAYLKEYPEDAEHSPGVAVSALSAAWAQHKVMKDAGDTSCIKNANMALSSILQGDEMIDLVITYQIRSPLQMVTLPGNFFLQRASVRAWTGRKISGKKGDGSEEQDGQDTVYVTATGSVYHENPECTHLKLSIRKVDREDLESLRNSGGGKYHVCEKCGDSGAGGSVYITNEGGRYHTSLSCSGLKRTVREVSSDEAEHMRACSKCSGQHG